MLMSDMIIEVNFLPKCSTTMFAYKWPDVKMD